MTNFERSYTPRFEEIMATNVEFPLTPEEAQLLEELKKRGSMTHLDVNDWYRAYTRQSAASEETKPFGQDTVPDRFWQLINSEIIEEQRSEGVVFYTQNPKYRITDELTSEGKRKKAIITRTGIRKQDIAYRLSADEAKILSKLQDGSLTEEDQKSDALLDLRLKTVVIMDEEVHPTFNRTFEVVVEVTDGIEMKVAKLLELHHLL